MILFIFLMYRIRNKIMYFFPSLWFHVTSECFTQPFITYSDTSLNPRNERCNVYKKRKTEIAPLEICVQSWIGECEPYWSLCSCVWSQTKEIYLQYINFQCRMTLLLQLYACTYTYIRICLLVICLLFISIQLVVPKNTEHLQKSEKL